MTVGHFCNREVVVTGKDSTIVEVAQLMRRLHVGDVVVVDASVGKPRPLGIITDRDLVIELIAAEVDLASVTAGDIMSFELITAKEEDSIWHTLRRMQHCGVRRLPVVNSRNELEGILAIDDVLEILAEEFSLLAKVSSFQLRREEMPQT